jgi:hypothetical protein
MVLSSVPEEAVPRLRASGGRLRPRVRPPTATKQPPPRAHRAQADNAEAPPARARPDGDGQVTVVPETAREEGPRPADGDGQVGESGRPPIRGPRGAMQDVAEPSGRTPAEVVKAHRGQLQPREQLQPRSPVPPGPPSAFGGLGAGPEVRRRARDLRHGIREDKPPSPGPFARWRARRAVREEARAAAGVVRPPSAIGRWRARRRIGLEAGRGRPPRPSLLARARARRSASVMPRPPRPGLGHRLATRRTTAAAPAPRTGQPPLRTRQDRIMAGAALLLIAGAFSTFAVLRSDRSHPVSRVVPPVASPSLQLEPSPTGGDLATPGALPPAEHSPSPRPRLGLARGAGIASTGATPSPSSAAAVPPSPAEASPPTVKPSQTAPPTQPPSPTTEPPEPSPSPTVSPSPSPTGSPSPSPSPSDDDDD